MYAASHISGTTYLSYYYICLLLAANNDIEDKTPLSKAGALKKEDNAGRPS
jgi:hypothetical protein